MSEFDEYYALRAQVRDLLRAGKTSKLEGLVEQALEYVGETLGIKSKAELFNDLLRGARPATFKPSITKLLELLGANDATYEIAAINHSAHLVRLLRERFPSLNEHANNDRAFKAANTCYWSGCADIGKRLHDGLVRECFQAFLERADLESNGYDSLLHSAMTADNPTFALVEKELTRRGTPMESIAGVLFDKLTRATIRCRFNETAARRLLKHEPILPDATVALASENILTHCNQKFMEEFCDAYGSQIPPDIVHDAILKTVYYKPIKTVAKRRDYLVSRFNFDLMDETYCCRVAVYGHLNDLQVILGRGYDPLAPESKMFWHVCSRASDPRKVTLLMDYGCVVTQTYVDAAFSNQNVRVLRLLLKQGKFSITNDSLVRAMSTNCGFDVMNLLLTKYKLDPSENDIAAFHAGVAAGRIWACSKLIAYPRFSFEGLSMDDVAKVLMGGYCISSELLSLVAKHFGRDELVAALMALRLGGTSNYSLRNNRYNLVCKLTGQKNEYDGGQKGEFNPTEDGADGRSS
jgi:hypothetical protein